MLSVDQALNIILSDVAVLPAETVPLIEALGRVLVEPAIARDDLPPFANSAMDGYAVRAADIAEASAAIPVVLKVVADIPAGTVSRVSLAAGETARIMTGAPLPEGANAIVPVEDTNEPWREPDRPLPDMVQVRRSINEGDYVRWPGEDIESGTIALPAGHTIRPQETGVLASLGITAVSVVRRPRVGVLATGDELISANEPLSPGKIRNSNSYALLAQVHALGAMPIDLGVALDSESDLRLKLQSGIEAGVDLFISSAGVSVGAYDVVKEVMDTGGEVEFWRVNMRPGKPLAFGSYGEIPYLGLPGNPVSAMVSFERFARPAIRKMSGHQKLERPRIKVTLTEDIYSDGRESYLRAKVESTGEGYSVNLSGRQGSHVMTSLVKANALVIIPAGVDHVPAGRSVEAMMLDWPETVF